MGNICVVFLLRGISACRISWHGSSWVTSPTLERFAAKSKVFDNHFANSIFPLDVDHILFHKHLLNSLNEEGIELIWLSDGLSSSHSGFFHVSCVKNDPFEWANELRKRISTNISLGKLIVIEISQGLPPWNLNKDERNLFFPLVDEVMSNGFENTREKIDGDNEATDEFVEAKPWIGDLPSHVDAVDDLTHLRIIETQAACLYGIDLFIEPMIQVLNSEIGVLVLGDRGIEVGDRHQLGLENPWPWYTRVHVPCIWYDPRGDLLQQRIWSFSHHGDVAETFGKFLSTNFVSHQGKSMDLLELARTDTDSLVERPVFSKGGADCLGIRFREWSLMKGNGENPKLFKLPQDMWEVLNLASQHTDIVEHLMSLIDKNL